MDDSRNGDPFWKFLLHRNRISYQLFIGSRATRTNRASKIWSHFSDPARSCITNNYSTDQQINEQSRSVNQSIDQLIYQMMVNFKFNFLTCSIRSNVSAEDSPTHVTRPRKRIFKSVGIRRVSISKTWECQMWSSWTELVGQKSETDEPIRSTIPVTIAFGEIESGVMIESGAACL